MPELTFTVHGTAAPAGSKTIVRGRAGRMQVVDSARKRGRPWRDSVQAAALEAIDAAMPAIASGFLEGALLLDVTFAVARPKGHYGARGLRPSAPVYPTTRPDTTKLLRALEDALTGIAWRDDAQVVQQRACKVYTDAGAYARVRIVTLDNEEEIAA